MYMYHKGDYSSEILLCFFPEDQYTRSYKYRMKAMDKMTELGQWEIKYLNTVFIWLNATYMHPRIKATLNY